MLFDGGVNEGWERPLPQNLDRTCLFEEEYALILTCQTNAELIFWFGLWLWGELWQRIRSKSDVNRE